MRSAHLPEQRLVPTGAPNCCRSRSSLAVACSPSVTFAQAVRDLTRAAQRLRATALSPRGECWPYRHRTAARSLCLRNAAEGAGRYRDLGSTRAHPERRGHPPGLYLSCSVRPGARQRRQAVAAVRGFARHLPRRCGPPLGNPATHARCRSRPGEVHQRRAPWNTALPIQLAQPSMPKRLCRRTARSRGSASTAAGSGQLVEQGGNLPISGIRPELVHVG